MKSDGAGGYASKWSPGAYETVRGNGSPWSAANRTRGSENRLLPSRDTQSKPPGIVSDDGKCTRDAPSTYVRQASDRGWAVSLLHSEAWRAAAIREARGTLR